MCHPDLLRHFLVFLTCNVGMKIGLWCTFSSWRITLGICQHAFQTLLWHYPLFLTYNVRMKIAILRTFSSWRVTLGTKSDDSRRVIKVKSSSNLPSANDSGPRLSSPRCIQSAVLSTRARWSSSLHLSALRSISARPSNYRYTKLKNSEQNRRIK